MLGWNLLIIIVVGIPVTRLVLIPFDRRRRWRAGKELTPPGTGGCASCQMLELPVEQQRVEALVLRAFERCGVRPEPRRAPPSWWLAYSGFNWKTGTWGYEYAIAADQPTPTLARFWCCSRPRFTNTHIDFGLSGRRANRLATALYDEAMRPPA